ncbi:DinB family protein [Neobacillus drentensis]|uniref:DinB family protein n=1 Tax=Neobacillus drentensis TaxID=220684 RepID=UPI0030039BD9
MVFWNERYLNRFKEIPVPEMQGDNNSTFTAVLEWAEAVERFNAVMTDWYNAVRECEDAKLDQPVNTDSNHPWIETLTNITLHNAHHIGQIVTIRKMQGSWDKEQGVS